MSVEVTGNFVHKNDPFRVIRKQQDYSFHYSNIENGKQLRATLRADRFAWPGGYPLYLICDDSAPVCFDCVRSNLYEVTHSIRNGISDGWRVVGCDVNWEDPMTCAHCESHIESAYGEE